jgi:rod shape-determining protein MreD
VRVSLAIVVPLVAALLQGSVAPLIAVAGARPNLVVLAAASWAVAAGPREAIWWAFLGGLAMDLLSGGPVGALALASLLPVAAIGLAETGTRPRSVLAGAALVAVASGAASLIYASILAMVGLALPDLRVLLATTFAGALYNGAIAIATYPLLRTLRRGTEKQASFSGQAW